MWNALRIVVIASLVLPAAVTAPGCSGDSSEEIAVAQEGLDSVELMSAESGVVSVSLDGAAAVLQMRTPPTPEDVAQAAAAWLEAHLQPAGCFSAQVTGAQAVYSLAECTGPRGLLHMTGTVTVAYSVSAAGIAAEASASGFRVNGAVLDIASDALFSVSAGKRHLQVTTQGSGTGPRGNALSYEGEHSLTFDDECFTLDGSWSRRGIAGSAMTTVSGYARCAGSCPTAGTISHTGIRGRTVTVSFDGSDVASFETSGGRSGTVDLLCTPAQ